MNTTAATRSGAASSEPPHHHPAHRVAEHPQVVEPGGVDDGLHVGGQPVEGVGVGVVGMVALAVAPVVEGDHPVVRREHLDVVGEVLFGTPDPVHQEQAGRLRGPGDEGRQAHSVVGRDAHRANLERTEQPVNEPVT